MTAFYGIVARELQRLLRRRSRLFMSLVRPMIWLFVVGSVVGAIAAGADPESYRRFILPGVLGLVLLFSAIFAAMSTATDRELGAIRLLLIAPVSRTMLVLAKIAGTALVALAQASLLLLLLPLVAPDTPPVRVVFALFAMLLTALTLASVGMMLASGVQSLEGFSGVANFISFPMLFLSGALYPSRLLPPVLQPLTAVNPLTYGIDLMKHALLGEEAGRFQAEIPIAIDLLVLGFIFVVCVVLAVLLFDGEARFTGRMRLRGG
ncbi:MAG: ABC transporter permease [Gemmatimonadota bacterium]